MNTIKLKAPKGAENLRGLTLEIKHGFIEVPEYEAPRYYQLGFYREETKAEETKAKQTATGADK